MRTLVVLATVGAAATFPAAAVAQQPERERSAQRGEAARVVRSVLGLAGAELLLKDERSRVFVTESVVARTRDCERVSRPIVDCGYRIVLHGSNPEPGEDATRARTACTGKARVRLTNPTATGPRLYTMRLRDFDCDAAPPAPAADD